MVDETRDETTIANADEATHDEIKSLSREDLDSQLGVTVTRQTVFDAHAAAANPHGTTPSDIDAATQDDMTLAQQDILDLQNQLNLITPANTFNMSVADNTLLAAVAVVTGTTVYTHHQITYDSTTEPTLGDGSWIAGDVLATYALPDTASHTYYLWIKDATTVTQVPPIASKSDGATVPGLVLEANYPDVGPSDITDLVVAPTVGSETTSLSITFSAATAGTSAIDHYELIDHTDGGVYNSDITPDVTTNHGGLQSDTIYPMQIKCVDANGLVSFSNETAIRTLAAPAGIVGIVAVSARDTADKTTGYYQEENAATTDLTVTLQRTSGDTGIVYVALRTVDDTALDGTNFYGRSESDITGVLTSSGTTATITLTDIGNSVNDGDRILVSGVDETDPDDANYNGVHTVVTSVGNTVTYTMAAAAGTATAPGTITVNTAIAYWGDGVSTDQDIGVVLQDVNMSTNKCFQFEIIKDSESGGCTVNQEVYDWGRGNSVLCYVNGSAAAAAGYQQDETGDNLLVVTLSDTTYATINDGTTGTWAVQAASDPGMTESGNRLRPDTWGIPSGANDTTLATGADEVSVSYPIVFTQTGAHYCWVRMYHPTDGSTDEVHFDIDGSGSELYAVWADNTNNGTGDSSNPRWKWVSIDSGSNTLTKTIASAGAAALKVHKYENTHRVDKILFTTSSSYDPTGVGTAATRGGSPSIDDNWGPSPSTYSAGASLVDDSGNLTFPGVPAAIPLDPDILIPADTTANVDVQRTEFTATFTGASDLVNATIVIKENGGSATIPGVTTVEGDGFNIAKFTASQTLISNTTYDVFLTADSIRDADGDLTYVDFTSVGDWQFTTVNTGTDFLIREDFSGFTAPHSVTIQDMKDTFILAPYSNINSDGLEEGDVYGIHGPEYGFIDIVDDPDGSPARGNVMRVLYPGGRQYQYPSLYSYPRLDADNTNVPYPSYDSIGNPTNIIPNVSPTEDKWDYTGGPPSLSKFATREVNRATTETAVDDLYLAYDLRLDDNWYYNFASKFSGIKAGTNLQASHGPVAFGDGIYGQQGTKLQLHGHSAWNSNPDGAAQYYLYDCYYAQRSLFMRRDGILPATNAYTDYDPSYHKTNNWQNCYVWPRGVWVTIEIRQKLNTAPAVMDNGFMNDAVLESNYQNQGAVGDGCLVDGIAEVWITDPRPVTSDPLTGGTGGAPVKMLKYVSMWRYHQGKKLDGITFHCSTNKPTKPDIQPNNPDDQYCYMDNIRVSESPITHE